MNIKIKMLYFGSCADAIGKKQEYFELKDTETLESLENVLYEKYPKISEILKTSSLSLNCEYCEKNTRLKDGDEIGLISPVSGG